MVHTWYTHDTLGMVEVGALGKHDTHGTHLPVAGQCGSDGVTLACSGSVRE